VETGTQRERFRVGDWLVEPSLNQVSRDGVAQKIEPRKMELLRVLARRPGELVTTEELLDTVWRGSVVTQGSVYQSVASLRRLLGDESDQPTYIETISRKGYRLIAPVVALEAATPEALGTAPSSTESRAARGQWLRWVAAGVVVALGVTIWLLPDGWFTKWFPASGAPAAVAVVPFADLSESRADQLFVDGFSEAVLDSLSRVPKLRVAARNSSFTARGDKVDVGDLGRKLSVTHVLEGSVRRSESAISVSAWLTDVGSGQRVWSETYNRRTPQSSGLQVQIARAVASELRVLPEAQGARLFPESPGVNVDAYELYLLGNASMIQRTPDSIARARDYFRTAVDIDPQFAAAYVGLARFHINSYYYASLPLRDMAARAQPMLDRALVLDPLLAEAHATQGLLRVELVELAQAEVDLRRAISLNPNYADAWLYLGLAAASDGRPRDSLDHYQNAVRLDPLNFILHVRMGLEASSTGRFGESERHYRHAMDLAPGHPNASWGMAFIYMQQGRLTESLDWYRRAIAIDEKRPIFWIQMAWVLMDLGRFDEANEAFGKAAAASPRKDDIVLEQAYVVVAQGDIKGIGDYIDKHQVAELEPIDVALEAAWMQYLAGRTSSARRQYDRAVPIALARTDILADPWDVRWGRSDLIDAASFYVLSGDAERAKPLIEEVSGRLDRFEKNGNVWAGISYIRARIHSLQGENAAALAELEKAYERGWRRAWWMRMDPSMRRLAHEPRFVALIQRMEAELQPALSSSNSATTGK
jgi:TolB-like protein/DNA-binding winged helix-turn-helix (wHTH) protein/Tfp pilus assembly protein PilF